MGRFDCRRGNCGRRSPICLRVVDALDAPSGLAGGLDRRQQQADEDGDDRNDDQQLDQGEPA